MKRQLYIILASIFVGLGTIGIFLPLVPTTPFLLLATYFYMNSSQKRLRWLLRNRLLGPYIRSYLSKEGIPLQLKIRTLILLWA
ncbi:MAG: YbaN family protein, partial [Bacteroidales bacterium]|nr:YbaN family protein [Bacteroidales bacterium]